MKYLHVSVLVGKQREELLNHKGEGTGVFVDVPTRTPKGKGGTARKNPQVSAAIRHARGVSGTRPTGIIIDDPIAEHST